MLSSYDIVILFGSLLILGAAALTFWRMAKQVKKRQEGDSEYSIGDYINDTLLKEQSTFVVFVLFMINIAEGILSASIHPPHEMQINPIARFFTHVSIALVGILAAVNFAKACIDFFHHMFFITEKITVRKVWNWIYALILACVASVIGWLAIYLPYWNLSIIATGLGQMNLAEMAFYNTFAVGGQIDFTQYGYEADFNPFANMSFQMRASWILVLCHYALGIYDSLLAVRTWVKQKIRPIRSADEKMGSKAPPASKEDVNEIKDDATDVFHMLLDFLQYKNRSAKVESLIKAFSKLESRNQNRVANGLASLKKKVEKFEEEMDRINDPSIIKSKRRILTDQIFTFFAKPVSEGGMAQPLSRGAIEDPEEDEAADQE